MLTISLLQSLVSLRKIFISEKFREVSVCKPSKQTFIMEDIQEKYNHLLQQNEAIRQENEELKLLLHAHGIEYKPKHAEEKDSVYSPFTFPSVKLSIEERVAIFSFLIQRQRRCFCAKMVQQNNWQERLPTCLYQRVEARRMRQKEIQMCRLS